MVVAALAVVAFLLVLGAMTGRSGDKGREAGSDGGAYATSMDAYGGDSGHCHTGDFGGGDCGGGDGGGGGD